MTHRMTVRLSDESWTELEHVLAVNNITASAFFEASAIFLAKTAQANDFKPYVLWTDTMEKTVEEGWDRFFELAKSIDVARRSRRPDGD